MSTMGPEKNGSRLTNDVDNFTKKEIICFRCKQPGHVSRDCKTTDGRICFKCKQSGHMANSCTIRPENIRYVQAVQPSVTKYLKRVKLNGQIEFMGFIDTGSDSCLIRESLVVNRMMIDETKLTPLYGFAGKSKMKTMSVGTLWADMEIDGVICNRIPILVLRDEDMPVDAFIGRSFLDRSNVVYCKRNDELIIMTDDNPVHNIQIENLVASINSEITPFFKENNDIKEEEIQIGLAVNHEENKSLKEEMMKLLGEVGDLKDRVVKVEETTLKNQIITLEEENASLIKEISCLRREIDCLCQERQFLSKNLKTFEDNLAKNNIVEEIGKKNDLEEVIRILNEDNAVIIKENKFLGEKNVNLHNDIVKLREEMNLFKKIPEDLHGINMLVPAYLKKSR